MGKKVTTEICKEEVLGQNFFECESGKQVTTLNRR